MKKYERTTETKLLLCEGNDFKKFFEKVFKHEKVSKHFEPNNIFPLDVGGINDEKKFKAVANRPDFSEFDTIVYVRDAEHPQKTKTSEKDHYDGVIKRIKNNFDSIKLSAPDQPFLLSEPDENGRKCGYIIITAPNSKVGALEDLCINIAVDNEAVEDSKKAFNCINKKRNGKLDDLKHKRLFHSFLAFNKDKDVVGALSGQAVERNAFDLEHENFKPIIDFLKEINNS